MNGLRAAIAAVLVMTATGGIGAPPTAQIGQYRNPVLTGDYSDPDVVRVGDDYYLVASSFSNVPGLPILHSTDLVHWTLLGHALPRLSPEDHFATPRRGGGVWAPAIVHRGGMFRIYYPDPDRGIFVVTARDPRGPWSTPTLVDNTQGVIDPAPFWDDDGSAWMAMAFAASRAGFQNVVLLKRMDARGNRTLDAGVRIVEGDKLSPVRTSIGMRPWQTTEGPKLYKRDGWYWLFTPSGSVKGGWQGVFRARKITGPWEGRNVMDQGPTQINGPHQGAWVTTAKGEDWFLHFSDADSYGRQIHLQPMRWRGGWPVIGADPDGDGIGQPVETHAAPRLPRGNGAGIPVSDEFDGAPNIAWQWNSNPRNDWIRSGTAGELRMGAVPSSANLWEVGNLLTQKLPDRVFTVTSRLRFAPVRVGERTGLSLFGSDYGWIGAERTTTGSRVVQITRRDADKGGAETVTTGPELGADGSLWVRMTATPITVRNAPPDFSPYWPSMLRSSHAETRFSYSLDGKTFVPLGDAFVSRPGRWVGAQIGIFAQATGGTPAFTANTTGFTGYDWVRITQ